MLDLRCAVLQLLSREELFGRLHLRRREQPGRPDRSGAGELSVSVDKQSLRAEALASAALDRPLHRRTVINVRGEIYRLKENRKAGASGGMQAYFDERLERWQEGERGEEIIERFE